MNFTPFISISSFISEISHVTANIYCNVSHFIEPHLSLPWFQLIILVYYRYYLYIRCVKIHVQLSEYILRDIIIFFVRAIGLNRETKSDSHDETDFVPCPYSMLFER